MLVTLLPACAITPPGEAPTAIVQRAHAGGSVLAFAQSETVLASGGWEGGIRLWSVPDGRALRRWRAHQGAVNGLVYLADDAKLLSAGYDGTLALWQAHGALLRRVGDLPPVMHLAADEASDLLVTGHKDGSVRLWSLASLQLRRTYALHDDWVKAVAVHGPSGRFASSGADVRVFVGTVDAEPRLLPHAPMDAWTLAFAPDGRTLYGAGWFRLQRWNLAANTVTTLPTDHGGIIRSIQFGPEGAYLASISRQTDSAVLLLDPQSGEVTRRFQHHELCGGYIRVSADGRYMATTSDDASVRLYDLTRPDATMAPSDRQPR